jgi:glycosyltransferase involved in cell wall biosynthesis
MNNVIGIVIATKRYSKNLFKTIESINRQNYLPREIIIVSNDRILQKLNLNKKIILKKYTSKIKNQVFQRNIAINNISKECNLILQLDDRILLDKTCLYELNEFWKKSDQSVIGVGLNQINKFKERGLFNKIIYNFNLKGKVLSNGINFDYSNLKKDLDVMWLKGGLSSWRIKKNKKIKDRKYPLWKWSVFEDVEFCLKKNMNDKLLVSHKAKAKVIEKKQKPSINDLIYRGSIYTYSQKKIVKKYFKNMTFFFLTIPVLIFFSLIISVFTLNFSKFIYNYGRLIGFFKIDFN